MKAQPVRVLDVFVIGPTMVWAGWKLRKKYPVRGNALMAMGAGTVVYNGRNWLLIRDAGKAAAKPRPIPKSAPVPSSTPAPEKAAAAMGLVGALSSLADEAQSWDKMLAQY